MLYNAPSGSTDPNASYVGKDVASGRQGSKLPPTVPEGTQREIIAIIAAAQAMGLAAPTNADLQQMLKAVRSGLLSRFPATGTADAIGIAPQPAYVGLVEGMRFRFKIPGATNSANTTSSPVLSVNGLPPAPILRRDGTATAKGDLKAGQTLEVEIDAAGNARAAGPLASDTTTILAARNIVGVVPVFSYEVTGTYTFTVPSDMTKARTRLQAPGGGGGGNLNQYSLAGGGCGGGDSDHVFDVKENDVITMVLGPQGAAGASGGGNGGAGGTCTVLLNGVALHSATGGAGGFGASSGTSGSVQVQGTNTPPGTGSGGNVKNGTGGFGGAAFQTNNASLWVQAQGGESANAVQTSGGNGASGVPGKKWGGGGGGSSNPSGGPGGLGGPPLGQLFRN